MLREQPNSLESALWKKKLGEGSRVAAVVGGRRAAERGMSGVARRAGGPAISLGCCAARLVPGAAAVGAAVVGWNKFSKSKSSPTFTRKGNRGRLGNRDCVFEAATSFLYPLGNQGKKEL